MKTLIYLQGVYCPDTDGITDLPQGGVDAFLRKIYIRIGQSAYHIFGKGRRRVYDVKKVWLRGFLGKNGGRFGLFAKSS